MTVMYIIPKVKADGSQASNRLSLTLAETTRIVFRGHMATPPSPGMGVQAQCLGFTKNPGELLPESQITAGGPIGCLRTQTIPLPVARRDLDRRRALERAATPRMAG